MEKRFPLTDQITASLKKNGVSSAIILGELYVVDQDGKTVPLSQQRSFTQAPKNLGMQESMRFAAFDILEINGKNIEDTPYAARMDILKPLIHGDAVKVVEHWRSKGGMNEVMEAWNEGISNDPNFEGLMKLKATRKASRSRCMELLTWWFSGSTTVKKVAEMKQLSVEVLWHGWMRTAISSLLETPSWVRA